MHITSLVISGFKTYKEPVRIDFSPKYNVIVGENGSGKSNIFKAIEFMFNYETESSYDVRSLNLAMAQHNDAYIEITMENSNGKIPFPYDSREIKMRREFSGTNDMFYVNGIKTNRTNFLEQINFPKKTLNIVKQGTGSCVSIMTERDHFQLLMEACGETNISNLIAEIGRIRVIDESKYEERKLLLAKLDQKIESLNSEMQKTTQFKSWKVKKQTIEHVLCTREIQLEKSKMGEKLNIQKPMERDFRKALKAMGEFATKKKALEDSISTGKKTLSFVTDQISEMKHKNLVKIGKRDILILEEKEYTIALKKKARDAQNESEEPGASIAELEERLSKATAELKSLLKRENENCLQLDEEEAMKELYAYGLTCEFNEGKLSKWIEGQLKEFNGTTKKIGKEAQVFNNDLAHEKEVLDDLNSNLKEKKDGNGALRKQIEKLSESIRTSTKQIDEIKGQVETKRNEISINSALIEKARTEIDDAQHSLIRKMGKPAFLGFKNFQLFLKRVETQACVDHESEEGLLLKNALPSIRGTVLDCIEWDDHFDLAMEAIGGGEFLHYIADDIQSCKRLMNGFNEMNYEGSVSFLPIDILQPREISKNVQRLLNDDKDVQTLISKCRYKEGIEEHDVNKAIKSIFMSTLLCRSIESCSEAQHKYKMKAVTLEGDVVYKHGVMKGGYIKPTTSTREIYHNYTLASNKYREALRKMVKLNQELTALEKVLQESSLKHVQLENDKEAKLARVHQYANEFTFMTKVEEIRSQTWKIENLQRKMDELNLVQMGLIKRYEAIKKYRGSKELVQKVKELVKVPNEVSTLRKITKEILKQKNQLTIEKKRIEKLIAKSNMSEVEKERKRVQEADENKENNFKSKERQRRIGSFNEEIQKIKEELVDFKSRESMLKTQLKEALAEFEKVEDEEQQFETVIQSLKTKLEIIRDNLKLHENVVKSLTEKRSLLGIDSSTISENYLNQSCRDLIKGLESCNKKIENFLPFQFSANIFEAICTKYNELLESSKSMANDELTAETLGEMEKYIQDFYPIFRSSLFEKFKTINKTFGEMTLKLLGVKGDLRFMFVGEETFISIQDMKMKAFETFWANEKDKGLCVYLPPIGSKSKISAKMNVRGLSGGQKSLISIALILSFVKMSNNFFFLLDEIDAPLDPDRRTELAKILKDVSAQSQIILTTFNKQLLEFSDRVLVVQQMNQSSRVHEISTNEGMELLNTSSDFSRSISDRMSEISDINSNCAEMVDHSEVSMEPEPSLEHSSEVVNSDEMDVSCDNNNTY